MILLLGSSGYVGQAFAQEMGRRRVEFISLSRSKLDYSQFEKLLGFLGQKRPAFVINAAGYTGKPNVDACETARAETLVGNTLLPQTIAQACAAAGIPWGHISSGCIYTGSKVQQGGRSRIEPDLLTPELRSLWQKNPEAFPGFAETDEPNFTFRRPPCSFYSGTKALAEEALAGTGLGFIWRLRIPFDEFDNPRNYLTKLQRYPKVYENVNSLSHRADFAAACLDLWERRAPFGTYNVTHPGFIHTGEVVEMIQRILRPARKFEFWESDAAFYKTGALTPRSNCVLDVSKLLATGVRMRPVREALEDALRRWQPAAAA